MTISDSTSLKFSRHVLRSEHLPGVVRLRIVSGDPERLSPRRQRHQSPARHQEPHPRQTCQNSHAAV